MEEKEPVNKIELFNISASASPSPYDSRDLKINEDSLFVDIPDEYEEPTDYIDRVHQKKIGCCTMASLTKLLEELEYKKTGIYTPLSVRFSYTVLKRYIDLNVLEGSSMRNALKAMQKIGTVPESMYPSDFSLTHDEFIAGEISDELLREAKNHRIGAYFQGINDKSLIPRYIKKYGMIYARFECGLSWYSDIDGNVTWIPDLIMPLRQPNPVVSGHAVLLKKYNLNDRWQTWVFNSWGRAWGKGGDAFYYPDDFGPTEVWIVTLDPVPEITGVSIKKEVLIESDQKGWRKFFDLIRSLGNFK